MTMSSPQGHRLNLTFLDGANPLRVNFRCQMMSAMTAAFPGSGRRDAMPGTSAQGVRHHSTITCRPRREGARCLAAAP